jgi:two-component system sensor histidine kinase RegB
MALLTAGEVYAPQIETFESRLRLQTIVRLRWFAIIGQVAAVAVVSLGLKFPLPVAYCMLLIALSAWLNVFLRVFYPARHRLSPLFATALLGYDVLQLAALLYLTGGIENPFIVLMVAPVTVSAATLPLRNTLVLGMLAAALTAGLTFQHKPLPWMDSGMFQMPLLYRLGASAAVLSCMTFLALYAWRLSKEARQMSAALSATELVLAREQRLHALDGLAAAAAHELGTPLSTIVLVTKELERDVAKDSAIAEDIALLRAQALRCREILQKLTKRPTEGDPMHAHVTLSQMIDEAVAPYRGGRVRIQVEASPVQGAEQASHTEPVGLRRPGVIYGLGNIVENAVDFASSTVDITARWSDRLVEIVVTDDGPGFSPEILDALGDPYVTTRAAGTMQDRERRRTGLGLGFFIAKTLLERSGASLDLGNRSARPGAVVTITWPRPAFEGAAQADPWAGAVATDRALTSG